MNKFYELSFVNHIRNNDDLSEQFDKYFEPVINKLGEILSESKRAELEDLLSDCASNAFRFAGVVGMELAVGVIDGTIKQKIEDQQEDNVMDNRQKLHQMIDRIDSDRALAYLESFIKHWINEFSVDLKGGQGYEE